MKMQKFNSNADKKLDKNNGNKLDKIATCDGCSCKVVNDDKNIKCSKKIMIDINIK